MPRYVALANSLMMVDGNDLQMRVKYFRRPPLCKNHPRNGNTLHHVHNNIILSVNAGGYIFIKNTINERIPAWIWSGYQGIHQLNFNDIR